MLAGDATSSFFGCSLQTLAFLWPSLSSETSCRGSVRIRHAAGPSWFTARLRLSLEVQSRVRQRIAYKRSLGSDSADGSIVGKAAERSVIRSASDRRTHSNSQEGSYSVQCTAKIGAPTTIDLFLIYRSGLTDLCMCELPSGNPHTSQFTPLGHNACPVHTVPQQSQYSLS